MKAFRVTIKLKNNRLTRLREELNMTGNDLAEAAGITASHYSAFENLKVQAFNSDTRTWKPSALKLAEFHGVSCEWLWPDEIRAVRAQTLQLEASAQELVGLPPSFELEEHERRMVLEGAMTLLKPHEQKALEWIREGGTLDDIGRTIGVLPVSRERVRQIVLSGLRKLGDMSYGRGPQIPRKDRERLLTDPTRLAIVAKAREVLGSERADRMCSHTHADLHPKQELPNYDHMECRACGATFWREKAKFAKENTP